MTVGQVIDGWEVESCLQESGHSGAVYRVRRISSPRQVAILKHYNRSCSGKPCQFLYEDALLAKQLVPGHVPRHFGRGIHEQTPYFVMEMAERLPAKLSFRQLLRALKWIIRICKQLAEQGYIHCDIKPDNIGIIDNRIVLLDFGLARKIEDATRHPARVGTDPFEAPEVRDGHVSVRSEIYSIAATAHALASRSSLALLSLAVIPALAKNPGRAVRAPRPSRRR